LSLPPSFFALLVLWPNRTVRTFARTITSGKTHICREEVALIRQLIDHCGGPAKTGEESRLVSEWRG
jgi:hypothetical protein